MASDDLFSDDDDWGKKWDDEELDEAFSTGSDGLVAAYVGYEVELQGTNPVHLRVVRPGTAESSRILVGAYPDCVVVLDDENYTIIPQSLVVVSVPRNQLPRPA